MDLFPHNLRINYRMYLDYFAKLIICCAILVFFLFFIYKNQQLEFLPLVRPNINTPTKAHLRNAAYAISKNNIDVAREELLEVLAVDPDNMYARNLLDSLRLENKGEVEGEIVKVKAILAAQPGYRAAWEKLANLYLEIGDLQLASEARQKASSLPN